MGCSVNRYEPDSHGTFCWLNSYYSTLEVGVAVSAEMSRMSRRFKGDFIFGHRSQTYWERQE